MKALLVFWFLFIVVTDGEEVSISKAIKPDVDEAMNFMFNEIKPQSYGEVVNTMLDQIEPPDVDEANPISYGKAINTMFDKIKIDQVPKPPRPPPPQFDQAEPDIPVIKPGIPPRPPQPPRTLPPLPPPRRDIPPIRPIRPWPPASILIDTLKFQTILRTCTHVIAQTCYTSNIAKSVLAECLVPSLNQCIYPDTTTTGTSLIRA